jgi:hypothetical protein
MTSRRLPHRQFSHEIENVHEIERNRSTTTNESLSEMSPRVPRTFVGRRVLEQDDAGRFELQSRLLSRQNNGISRCRFETCCERDKIRTDLGEEEIGALDDDLEPRARRLASTSECTL